MDTPILETIEALAAESFALCAPAEVADALGVGVERIGSARLVACRAIDHGWMNRVIGLGVGEPLTEAKIDAAIDGFGGRGIPNFYLQIAPSVESGEVAEWLAARGLVRHSRNWAKFRRGPTAAPPPERTKLRVTTIGREHGDAFAQVVVKGYGMPASVVPWLAALPGTPGWDVYLAFDGTAGVSAAAMFSHGGASWLGFAA